MAKEEPKIKPPAERRNLTPVWMFLLLIFGAFYIYQIYAGDNILTKEITWQQFENEMLTKQKVQSLEVVNQEMVNVYLKPEYLEKTKIKRSLTTPSYYFRIGSIDVFENKIDEIQKDLPPSKKIEIKYSKRTNWIAEILPWLLPVILLFFAWKYIFNRTMANTDAGGRSVFSFGKSSAQLADKGKGLPTFKNVAGYEEAKMEIMEIVDFLKNPGNFTRLGAKIPKGVLLIGPPGTGKTLMAKAVAGEAEVPFFSLSGSEFVEMFVGVGASRVRDLFKTAKTKAPCIIFIDELDTVGRSREKVASFKTNDERESTLNQLLAEMDGFDSDSRIIVLAATNRADILDPALIRAGRFDRHVYLELPNKNERVAIFNVHMKRLKFNKDTVNPEFLSSQTPGFSGADIANVCNEAALTASRQKKEVIDLEDFTAAIEKVIGGLEKKSMVITEREKKIIAYHEAGHAITSWMLPNIDPVIKLSIIPRGKSLGSTWYLPEEKKIMTKSEFEDGICTALGGRAAEEIKFNELSSGALDDLEKVRKTAYSMVVNLGFDEKIGHMSFHDSSGMDENSLHKPFSETTARIIDEEVYKIIDNAYNKARDIISSNKGKLEKLAKLLLEKESLYEKDIRSILGVRPVKEKIHEEEYLSENNYEPHLDEE